MRVSLLALLGSSCLFLAGADEEERTYDVSWFPVEWPEPGRFLWGGEWSAMDFVHDILTARETPIAVFYPMNWHNLEITCVTLYSNWLDKLSMEEPPMRMNENMHTSYHRMTCIIYARQYWFKKAGDFKVAYDEGNKQLEAGVGPDTLMSDEVVTQIGQCISKFQAIRSRMRGCLSVVYAANVDTNDHLASASFAGAVVAEYIINDMRTTQWAWNWDGGLYADGEPCVNNCMVFSDWTGYTPVNSAHEIKDPKRWQPLIETNQLGFVFTQEHVTAQLSQMDLIIGDEDMRARRTPDPQLDYKTEMELVYETMNDFSKDDERITKTKIMDNKLAVLIAFMNAIDEVKPWTLESAALYFAMFVTAEHDALIMAWKEKLQWDLIRPTSVSMMMGGMYRNNGEGVFVKDQAPMMDKSEMEKDKLKRRRMQSGRGSGSYSSTSSSSRGRGSGSYSSTSTSTSSNGRGSGSYSSSSSSSQSQTSTSSNGRGSGSLSVPASVPATSNNGVGRPAGSGRYDAVSSEEEDPVPVPTVDEAIDSEEEEFEDPGANMPGMEKEEVVDLSGPLGFEGRVERVPWIKDQTIDPRQWTPFIRVMPHSEYPSGSMAICTAIADFTKLFLPLDGINDPLRVKWELEQGGAGYGLPSEDVVTYTEDMDDFAETCGQSRLWGGMHFRAAVPAAADLVEGLGAKAFEIAQQILNGDTLKPHVNLRKLRQCSDYKDPDDCGYKPHCSYDAKNARCTTAVCLTRKDRKKATKNDIVLKTVKDRAICFELIELGICKNYKGQWQGCK